MTLDEDVAARLKAEMQATGASFKATVNTVLRRGFVTKKDVEVKPFLVKARDLGLRVGYDLEKPFDLIEQLDGPLYR